MVHIFDGRKFTSARQDALIEKVKSLKDKGITPKLVSILVGDDEASKIYLSEKKKGAESIGAINEIVKFDHSTPIHRLIGKIEKLNEDESVHGIMVQLPLPPNFSKKDLKKVIDTIDSQKDVDGMQDDSPYVAPVVKAVIEIINQSPVTSLPAGLKFVVIGAKGFVGRKIVKALCKEGYEVEEVDIDTKNLNQMVVKTDVLISATGSPNLIKENMVKKGAVVIDVGYPKADVEFNKVSKKASFITPVPGGVGPVTVYFLLENLLKAIK
jgi:methylenetetrahydrofolate dehydrogenase (NADP+)/methenyltetrahydrofolate cyclohydrolase